MRYTFAALLFCASTVVFGQAKTRRLPSIINHPSNSLYAPYISLDGNALLFVANTGQDGALALNYTSRESDWTAPVEMPKHLSSRLNFLKGYALSADGKKIYFTSAKSPVVGGYDLFVSELKGGTWSAPENLTAPINSKTNDGSPSISADGSTLYFMRCDRMDQNKAAGCQIFVAKKKPNGQWDEPTALGAHINTGNSQTPRIMADNETLIFSSDKNGGQGGMDLFVTKLKNGEWSAPVPMDFVNTAGDDQFVSAAALGRYLLKEGTGTRNNSEITEFLFPAELRPRGMMKVEGKITDEGGAPINAFVMATDLSTGKRVFTGKPNNDGSYALYLLEGTKYELSIEPEINNVSFVSRQFDLTTDKIPQKEKLNATLKKPVVGDELTLDLVRFKPNGVLLEPSAESELKRLARLSKGNPDLKFEIQVLLNGYVEDTIQSSPDLTEKIVDSIRMQVEDIDSLGQLYKRDTTVAKALYHNNRTQQQGQAIVDYLVSQGASASNFSYFGNAIPALMPENKKLTIKAVARKK
jgi:Tol biopolymer transport system component